MYRSMKVRVAFDCMGTLHQPGRSFDEATMVLLYKWFESKGCEMFIWSSDSMLAAGTAARHGLKGTVVEKYSWADAENQNLGIMTIKVDDQQQDYLAAENTIYVNSVKSRKFDEQFGHFVTEEFYRKQATDRYNKFKEAEALIRAVEFEYPQGHPFRRQIYRGVVNTFSFTGNEISSAMQNLKEMQDLRLESALKCDRCEEWMEMGLSDTCPGCDMVNEEPNETNN